jgi:predicted nucleic acid-binding protein
VIVLDASAAVELLLDTATGRRVAILIEDPAMAVHVPHLLDVEVTSVLRRLAREGVVDAEDAKAAIEDLVALDLQRHSHDVLLERAWALRKNVTAYDAMYIALAEALGATLVTCDRKLAKTTGISAKVETIS